MPYDAKAQTTDVILSTWEERDRLNVGLSLRVGNNGSGTPLFDLWDEDCAQAFEDGFLKRGRMQNLSDTDATLVESALDYAEHLGLTKAFEARVAKDVDAAAEAIPAVYDGLERDAPKVEDEDAEDRRARLATDAVNRAMTAMVATGISDARFTDIEGYLTDHLEQARPAPEEAPAPGM